jgi:hypothetical protein
MPESLLNRRTNKHIESVVAAEDRNLTEQVPGHGN